MITTFFISILWLLTGVFLQIRSYRDLHLLESPLMKTIYLPTFLVMALFDIETRIHLREYLDFRRKAEVIDMMEWKKKNRKVI